MKGVCEKCPHWEICQTPCRPVELYLAQDNLAVYEKTAVGKDGKKITIVFAHGREIQESALAPVSDKTDDPVDSPFTTETESPFASFNPSLKQTGIFIDRFFHGWSYEDLAVKYDVSVEVAQSHYFNAVQRLQAVVEAMDGGKDSIRDLEPWKRMVEERSGSFSTGVRWFLLNKLLGVRPSEIAKVEGVKDSSGVRALIIRVSDQLRCGEISLFEADDPEKAVDAKAKLDAQRKKRRERHAKNKDRINAKRRAAYVPKNNLKLI
jgi:hypothetical protein